MLFQNLEVLGIYYDTIWTYVCCNFRHCKLHTHIQACIFLKCETYTGEILIWRHIVGVLSEKPQNTHNLTSLFLNGCLGWKFKNCWNDWLVIYAASRAITNFPSVDRSAMWFITITIRLEVEMGNAFLAARVF